MLATLLKWYIAHCFIQIYLSVTPSTKNWNTLRHPKTEELVVPFKTLDTRMCYSYNIETKWKGPVSNVCHIMLAYLQFYIKICEIRGCLIHAVEVTTRYHRWSILYHVTVLAYTEAASSACVWRPRFRNQVGHSFSSSWLLSLELRQRLQRRYEILSHTQDIYSILLNY